MTSKVLFQVELLEAIYDNQEGDVVDITAETDEEFYYENKSGTSVYLKKEDEEIVWKRVVHELTIQSSVISGKSRF